MQEVKQDEAKVHSVKAPASCSLSCYKSCLEQLLSGIFIVALVAVASEAVLMCNLVCIILINTVFFIVCFTGICCNQFYNSV